MHIFFSGIGGAGIGPLALVAKQAGFEVSGSDKRSSQYIDYLNDHGIANITIGQSEDNIAQAHAKTPIDWYVYSSAVEKENPDNPEIKFVDNHGIHRSKRDEFLSEIIKHTGQELIAIAGTHGKTTTTAMTVWLMQELSVPISYILPGKTSFADMGHFDPTSKYFIYEADEYDRNFLSYHPAMAIISGIDWDHPDIYPTRQEYYKAFRQFLGQSKHTYIWSDDADKLELRVSTDSVSIIKKEDYTGFNQVGLVNRENAAIATRAVMRVLELDDINHLTELMNKFPGVGRRFEEISKNIYSDYAHTPDKIRGAIQLAHEVVDGTDRKLVVVYEGLHNTRQHFIKDDLAHLFDDVDKLYVVPSYRAREDESLEDLTPDKLIGLMSKQDKASSASLDNQLKEAIESETKAGNLVLCLSAGGGGSLDEWLRQQFKK